MKKDAHSVVVCDFAITFTWANGADYAYTVRKVSGPGAAITKAITDVRPVADAYGVFATPIANTERRVTAKQYQQRVQAGKDPFDDQFFNEE